MMTNLSIKDSERRPAVTTSFSESGEAIGRWWETEPDGRILCQLCPRACRLNPGDRGFCFVRANHDGVMVLETYGRSTGFCIDPIEKKPLNHFFPGTAVLSFGTAGCNLGCKFCQNWDSSKSRQVAKASAQAAPLSIATAAAQYGCRSVAFTYNDPVIWSEYAIDTAAACHSLGLKTVAVTAGYITPSARGEFFAAMDAANIDLKGFTEQFYFQLTAAHLEPVLDTIRYVCNETDCWVELTNLVIPDANDDMDDLRRMCDWILNAVGDSVPIHFTAFHPDYRLIDRDRTDHGTLVTAYNLARQRGLRYVYVGNVNDPVRQSTYCPGCGKRLIERDWHQISNYALQENRCKYCQHLIAGHFDAVPGNWGGRRLPIQIPIEQTASQAANQVATPAIAETLQQANTRQRAENDANQPQQPNLPTLTESDVQNDAKQTGATLSFTDEQQQRIHRAACRLVRAAAHDVVADVSEDLGELSQMPVAGIYVTLKRGETLRGCCGTQGAPQPLGTALADAADRTAKHDPRMTRIAPVELPYLTVSVSILGFQRPIAAEGDARMEMIKIGTHGLRIRMGNQGGLLLPSVATERRWNARQFLDAVCNKAGLPPGSWRSEQAVVEIFDGVYFGGPFVDDDNESSSPCSSSEPPRFSDSDLSQLVGWIKSNLIAMQTGATPFYYATGTTDGTAAGVIVDVVVEPNQPSVNWIQFALRDGVPLQSTLFEMTQQIAASLTQHGSATNWQIHLAILTTAIAHGTAANVDLAGVDCRRRALVAIDSSRWAVAYDPTANATDLLNPMLAKQFFQPGSTQVYSAVCDTTFSPLLISLGKEPESGDTTRPPAVAGSFYPANDPQREQQVDELISGFTPVEKRSVNAAMVPHAGLRFSGRIAADVWRRIEMPESVLIIGPKHTADGVDWAVAPHERWQISDDASIAGDLALATRIADAVPRMQLDAAAHRREHGTEVQLPLLYRYAPGVRIASIAMSAARFEDLQQTAVQLADCIRSMPSPPLLVISSDMNHFADQAETERRDRLALQQLERLDPAGLLQVCEEENISMCGQIPAALVLLTLAELGCQASYQQIAYATSADVSGDRSRVVGYAGVLF